METAFLPERLKKIREERGLNKAEAARLLNLSKMGYQRYETTARVPSYQTIVFMAQKLATSPEYLTGLTDDPEPAELIISRESDPELFEMVRDIISTDHPARKRLLAYYKKNSGRGIEEEQNITDMGTLLIPTKNLRRYERRIGAVLKHSVDAER